MISNLYTRLHLLASNGVRPAAVTLLSNGELDTLALWKGDPWLLTTDDENVALTGSELVVDGILDVNNVETTIVSLTVGDDTNTTHVTTTSGHGDDTSVELNEVGDLAGGEVDFDSVVDLDGWVWVTDAVKIKCQHLSTNCKIYSAPKLGPTADRCDLRSSIMRNQVWNTTLAELNSLDLAQLVLGLLASDAVDGKATLGVVDEAEVLAGLLDGDDIHETSWVGSVSADLAVDLDEALHDNGLGLATVKGVLQPVEILLVGMSRDPIVRERAPVADEDDQRHAVSELVRTWRGLWCVGTGEFVQKPVAWCRQAVLVLSWSTSHVCDLTSGIEDVRCKRDRVRSVANFKFKPEVFVCERVSTPSLSPNSRSSGFAGLRNATSHARTRRPPYLHKWCLYMSIAQRQMRLRHIKSSALNDLQHEACLHSALVLLVTVIVLHPWTSSTDPTRLSPVMSATMVEM